MNLYLDCNATTPTAAEVVDAMEPFWSERMGNPSSSHRHGRAAKHAVEVARSQIASLINCEVKQIYFTANGTEANHIALQGYAKAHRQQVIAFSATEHPSILSAVNMVEELGWSSVKMPVDENGILQESALELLEEYKPALVTVMLANNETGVVQPMDKLIATAHKVGALVHIDASQAAGKIEVDYRALKADMMTISSHKLYGPKGVGVLVISPSVEIAPLMGGGGQERGVRAGTENVPAIVGFGAAAELAQSGLEGNIEHTLNCRKVLEQKLRQFDGVEIVAEDVERLPNTVMILVDGFDGETLLMRLDQAGAALSSGSACQAGKTEPSHLLIAMGISPARAKTSLRISLCRDITLEQVDSFIKLLGVQIKL